MSGENTVGKLEGFFKNKLASTLLSMIPDGVKLQKEIKFESSDKELGGKYLQPIQTETEGGITFAAANSGAFLLNEAVSAASVEAQVQGAQMLLRSAMSYEVAAKASSSDKAFMKAVPFLYMNMKNSIAKFLEIGLFYGQSSLGEVESATSVSSTQIDLVLTNKSYASGVWSGVKGHKYDLFDGDTKANPTLALTVVSVDLDSRKVRVSGNSADIAALLASSAALAIGSKFYFCGAKNGASSNEMAGLDRIITNTGVLHNVDAASVELWKGNVVSLAGTKLTVPKIIKAVGKAVERGLDEAVVCYISSETWATMAADADSIRSLDSSYDASKVERGHESIVVRGENGKIEIKTSIYVKRGEAFIFPPSKCKRIGSSEVTFALPGDDKLFTQMANNAGYEVRCYSDQALFIETPARCIKISDIDNASST